MELTRNTLIAALAIWIATLYGSYQLGSKATQGDAPPAVAAASTDAAAPDKATHHKSSSSKSEPAVKEAAPDTLPLKDILAKLKTLNHSGGGMQSPNAMMKIFTLLAKIRPEDFQDALKEAEDMTDQQSKMLLAMTVLSKWAETDGPAAMQYAQEHSKDQGIMGQMSKMSVASAWADQDPEAVWKWYNTTKDDADNGPLGGQMVLVSLFSSLAAKDPELAFKRLDEIDGAGKQMALAGMFQATLYDDDKRTALLKQVDAMPDKTERQQAKQSMLAQWAMLAPDQAIDYVNAQPSEDQASLRTSMGSMLMMSNPRKGAAFLLDGATDTDKASRYDTIVNSWVHQDPNAAGTWLNEQPQGPHLDNAKRSFVTATAEKDPTSAMAWATTITAPDTREAATTQAYTAWKKTDPTAAEAALTASGLTPEQITKIHTTSPPSGLPTPPKPAD